MRDDFDIDHLLAEAEDEDTLNDRLEGIEVRLGNIERTLSWTTVGVFVCLALLALQVFGN